MILKRVLSGFLASALAVTSVSTATTVMTASASVQGQTVAEGTAYVDSEGIVQLYVYDEDTDTYSGVLYDLGIDVTEAYSFSYDVTFDATELASEDKDSWIGGGIGTNSESTGWVSMEWGQAGSDKPIAMNATETEQTITYPSDGEPLFSSSDSYCQTWFQTWGGTAVITGFDVYDKYGNSLLNGEAYDLDLSAQLMFADTSWAYQYWSDDDGNGVVATNAAITGEGEYTASVTMQPIDITDEDGIVTTRSTAKGLSFAAISINNGEINVPKGKKLVLTVKDVTVDGEPVALTGMPYTSSDDGIITRANLYNRWVGILDYDDMTIRTQDGFLVNGNIDNIEGATTDPSTGSYNPVALYNFATSGTAWTTMSVTFDVNLIEDTSDEGYVKDGITYTFDDDTAIAKSYSGDAEELVIPDEINNCPVTRLADSLFQNNTELKKITIPDTVSKIGDYCFNGCTALEEVTLPSDLNNIGYGTFGGCTALKSISIPSNVSVIGEDAFFGCSSLTEITLSEDVYRVDDFAFANCSQLRSITVYSSYMDIGTYAFGYAYDAASEEYIQVEGVNFICYKYSDVYYYALDHGFTVTAMQSIRDYISDYGYELSQYSYIYDGTAKEPVVTIEGLTEGVDYTVSYDDNIEIGEARIIVTGIGNYSSTKNIYFYINDADVNTLYVDYDDYWYYTGEAITPSVNIYGLQEGTDFTVSYANNIEPGTATITIQGIGQYTGTKTVEYEIQKRSLSSYDFSLSEYLFDYTGTEIKPTVQNDEDLTEGTDYIVTYMNNVNLGTAKVTIKGIGNYTGEIIKSFWIVEDKTKLDCYIDENDSLANDYIAVNVDSNGKISIGTTGGDPTSSTDNNRTLTYGYPDGSTSYTTFVLDGEVYTYSGDTDFVESPTINLATGEITSSKLFNHVLVTQLVKIIENTSTNRKDVVEISYEIDNQDAVSHTIGLRVMLDIMVGNNDSAPFRIAGYGDLLTQKEFSGEDIPQYWQAFDELDNPGVISQGSFLRDTVNPPDRVQFANWGFLSSNKWNYTLEEGTSNGDSGIAIFWDEEPLAAGTVTTCKTYYGLSEVTADTNRELSAAVYNDLNLVQIGYDDDTHTPQYNDTDVTAYLSNTGSDIISNAKISIELPAGMSIKDDKSPMVEYDELNSGNIAQATWTVVTDSTIMPGTYQIIVHYSADGYEEKTFSRSITVPEGDENYKNLNVTISDIPDMVYTGSAIVPAFTVMDGETVLEQDTDYSVAYSGNINAGTATITISGLGEYRGAVTKTFEILPKSIENIAVSNIEAFVYSGTAYTPQFTITDNGKLLLKNDEYNYTYEDNVKAGTASIVISGVGNYTGTYRAEFTIEPQSISEMAATLSTSSYTYDSTAKTPVVTIEGLTEGTDFTVVYSNNTAAGTATVTITGKGNYTDTITKEFTIEPQSISEMTAILTSTVMYDGTAKEPVVTIEGLTEGTDFEVSYSNNVNAGTATVTITGKGNYTDTITKEFTIEPQSISEMTAIISSAMTYDGTAKEPVVTIEGLTEGTDFEVSYSNNVNAGTATGTITGKGNYTDTITKEFTIEPQSISEMTATLSQTVFVYGSASKALTVTIDGLTMDKDFTVEATNMNKPGIGTVMITGIGNYTGAIEKKVTIQNGTLDVTATGKTKTYDGKSATITVKVPYGATVTYSKDGKTYSKTNPTYTSAGTHKVYYKVTKKNYNTKTGYATVKISAKSISKFNVKLSTTSYTYDGKTKKPSITLKNGSTTLKNGTDYTVTYSSNKNPGTAKVTIKGKGNYSGTITKTYTIKLKTPTIKVTAGSKKATVKWSKVTGASGYEIYMATSKSGKYTKITTQSSSKTSYVKSKLTKGKTYYFKVRTYKTVSGKKVYSSYSSVKSVKVK